MIANGGTVATNYIKFLMIIMSIIFIIILIIPIDLFLGYFLNIDGIIFHPNSIISYETQEFKYTAKINKLGFRDREFDVSNKNKKK